MKMIEVLNMMAKGEIKDGTELEVHDSIGRILKYTFYGKLKEFHDERFDGMDRWFSINDSFLNFEVELIPPKPKKYYLRLDEDDDLSYINYNKEEYFCFMITSKYETLKHQSKFTQEEIDGSMFLKFIEQYGVKEEVAEDETD